MSAADLIRSRMNWDGLFETEEDTACDNSGEEVRAGAVRFLPILEISVV